MYAFIGGIPTSGKTHLVESFIKDSKLDIKHIKIDDLRNNLKNVKRIINWVNFFKDKDEVKYWSQTNCKQHMDNVLKQTNILWPYILGKIIELKEKHNHAIFEGVSIIPELARKYLDFEGFFLIETEIEKIYIRLKAHHRWGKTDDLKKIEANCFYENGVEYIKKEANKYGYKVFDNIEDGYIELSKIFFNQLN